MVVLKTKELLLGHADAAHYMTETILEDDVKVDLGELKHSFAVSQIDPRIGRIEVSQNTLVKQTREKITTPIEMIECRLNHLEKMVGM